MNQPIVAAARRGFTLLEVMVASAMALAIVAAATSAVMMIIRTMNRTGQSSAMITEAQLLSEYLVAQVQGTAGSAVRPWMVTVVENNAGPDNSDIYRFADIPSTLPTSAMITALVRPGTYSLFVPTPTRANPDKGRCGLAELRKDTDNDGFPDDRSNRAARFSTRDFANQQVILASPSGETWRSVRLIEAGLEETLDGCFVRFEGSSAGLNPNGFFKVADRISESSRGTEDLEQWIGGQVAFVRAREWRYVKATPGQSGRLVEKLVEAGETQERTLFEGVLDLQIAVGYDFDPFDGTLSETRDGNNDEWINQRAGDSHSFSVLPTGLDSPGSKISVELLRMIDVAVVIALPRAERTLTVTAFDGSPRTGPEARIAGGRAYLRNLLLFL